MRAGRRRGRVARLLALVVVGVVAGAVVSLGVQDRRAADDAAPMASERSAEASSTTAPVAERPGDGPLPGAVVPVTAAESTGTPTQKVLLAWMTVPLPPDLGPSVLNLDGVERVTAVRHATVDLTSWTDRGMTSNPAEGLVVPVDAIAVDPAGYAPFVAPELAAVFVKLGPRDAVLGRTGARLRGVDVGAVLVLEPGGAAGAAAASAPVTVTVTAVVDDAVIGGAELALPAIAGADLGVVEDRYLLVAHQGGRPAIEEEIRTALDAPVRFRGPGETPYLRDGDAVLPQAIVKAAYGEFAVRRGGRIEQEPAWQGANLVDVDLPVLGRVRCHRAVVDDLRNAMSQIERDNLGYLVDGSVACWYPGTIAQTGALSRGFWGIAVVLNSAKNPTGSASVQDPRIVAVMQANGFTWGGDFLVPEPAYFEHVPRER